MADPGDLVYLTREPLNAEVRVERIRGDVSPAGTHYVRDHFAIPSPPDRIRIEGAVDAPFELRLADLRALPERTVRVTLECAGNGRAFLDPPAPGEQWHLGAVGTADWTGVPLRVLLERARPRPSAVEVLFAGADLGMQKDVGRTIGYERSLPLADALRDDVLVAYAMNGSAIPLEHGAPARLVVPGWYGMASVKWLSRIRLIEHAFDGFFQKERYVIDDRPLREMAPRAVITSPADGAKLAHGRFTVRGRAWSGRAPVATVEVSSDNGYSWHTADLREAASPYCWREWSVDMEPGERGELVLLAFANTRSGEQQPVRPVRSALGYANNGARPVRVTLG